MIASRVLASHIAPEMGAVASKPRNRRFQTGESLLDLSHIVLDATDNSADRPPVFENQSFNIVGHGGSLIARRFREGEMQIRSGDVVVNGLQQNNQVAAAGIQPPRRFAPPLLSQGGEKYPINS